jgi:hypothetical protein
LMLERALLASATSLQCCARHHCRLELQAGSVVQDITAGLMDKRTLPA